MTMTRMMPASRMAISLPDVPDWTPSQKLAWEKETIGFYLTSHPLTQHARRIERYAANHNSELAEMEDGVQVTVGGMISSIKLATAKKSSRNGHNRYANFDLEDSSGIMRCIAWPEDYARYEELIRTENVIIVAGKVDRRSREPNLVVNRIYTLDQADKEFTAQVAIKFEKGLHSSDDIQRVRNVVSRFPGFHGSHSDCRFVCGECRRQQCHERERAHNDSIGHGESDELI